jgi:hypothetical protein
MENNKYSQKDKQKRGASFERDFRASANHIDCWIRKLITGVSGTPFDYIVLTEKFNYAVELKRIYGVKLPYSLIRNNQRVGLNKFEKLKNNRSIIICNINNASEDRCFLIYWNDVKSDICSGRKGSIDVKEFMEIPKITVNTKKIWDLEILIADNVTKEKVGENDV